MVDYGNTIVKNSKTGNKKLWKEILDHIGSDVQKHIIDGVEYESRADFDLRGTYAHKKGDPNAYEISGGGYISNPESIKKAIKRGGL